LQSLQLLGDHQKYISKQGFDSAVGIMQQKNAQKSFVTIILISIE